MRLQHSTRIFVTLAAALFAVATGCNRGSYPRQIGTTAPLFTINDGQSSVDLAKLRGQVVVLNFWATWCAPCVEEIPSLEALQQQLPQVKIVAISTDDDASAYQQFLVQNRITLFTVRDGAQSSNTLYGTYRFPETYVIDKSGIIRRKFIGPQDWTSPGIVDYLRKLAAQPTGKIAA